MRDISTPIIILVTMKVRLVLLAIGQRNRFRITMIRLSQRNRQVQTLERFSGVWPPKRGS